MKRYIVCKEYFGGRIYDSKNKTECFFDEHNFNKVKKVLNGEYDEVINEIFPNSFSAPLKISMNTTKKCNLRCKQCFSDSGVIKAEELKLDDFKKLFDDMRAHGTFFICLGGGEPFTREDLFDILEYGDKKQLAISVVTNGLLLNENIIKKLNSYNLDTLWISLDGIREHHDYLRGKGTFDLAVKTIEKIGKYFKRKKAIRISLNKQNIGDYKELIKIAEDNKFDIIRFTPIISFGRAKNEDLVITQDQYINFLKEIRNIKSKVNIIYPNMPNDEKIWIGTNGFGCHCGKEAIWIDEIGDYSPCIFWGEKYILGNIKKDDYMSLWKQSLKSVEYDGNPICKSCKNYKVCRGGCRARVYELTNSLNDVDPLCPLKRNKSK